MVRTGFLSALCLGFFLFIALGSLPGSPPVGEETALQNTLALQKAMETARFHLLKGETKNAVDVLEKELPRVNGDAKYLNSLRKAYRDYIKDLLQANNVEGSKRYLERLCILEPAAAQDPSLKPVVPTKVAPPEPKPGPLANLQNKFFPNFALNQKKEASPPAASAKPSMVRAKVEDMARDEDPFAPTNKAPGKSNPLVLQWVAKAEEEFAGRRYPEARVLYEKAFQEDKDSIRNSQDRWAYCILKQVVDQLNQPDQKGLPLAQLQQQVQSAVTMAPILTEKGNWLLGEIDQRQKIQGAVAPPEIIAQTTARHIGRNKEGWMVTETPSFLIFHNQTRPQVEKIAAIAETTRRDMYRKWFGNDGIEWVPKCELILHANGNDYSRMTGVSASSPGHSRIERDPSGQRVVSRRMDLRCDNPGMLDAILPHETTHVVLAGMFGNHDVPRWADEGIAVLTEPAYKVEQHRRNLERGQREGQLFRVQELMQLENYPEARRVGAFYAQSVCLVEFMADLRGPQVLTAFVRDGLRDGYDSALRKHYGMDMNEFQQRWQQYLSQGNHVAARP